MNNLLFFQPLDVWSFRDGRPFEAGEAFEAASIFPPPPWTTAGCIRTALLRRSCGDPEKYAGRGNGRLCRKCGEGPCAALDSVGPPGRDAPFMLGPPLPCIVEKGAARLFFPAPADLALDTDGSEQSSPTIFNPLDLPDDHCTSLRGLRPVGTRSAKRIKPFEPRWLTAAEMESYLAGALPAISKETSRSLFKDEPRIGIALDYATGSARDRQLYLRDTVRLVDGLGVAVLADRPLDLDREIARLGGDGRMARVSCFEVDSLPAVPDSMSGDRFKLYLASPAPLVDGWRPEWIDPESFEGVVPDTQTGVRLVALALAGQVSIGGWDLAAQQPRMMRRMAVAGTVLYFEVVKGAAQDVARALHGRSIVSDTSEGRVGFGLTLIGGY